MNNPNITKMRPRPAYKPTDIYSYSCLQMCVHVCTCIYIRFDGDATLYSQIEMQWDLSISMKWYETLREKKYNVWFFSEWFIYIYIFQIIKYKHDSHNTPELGTERWEGGNSHARLSGTVVKCYTVSLEIRPCLIITNAKLRLQLAYCKVL